MSRLSLLSALFVSIFAFAACDKATRVCAGVGYYALQMNIRDVAGRPQALGAAVTLYDGTYIERDSSYDTLNVRVSPDRGGGTYDVLVTKRYYNDVWIRGVRAPGGGCVEPGFVSLMVPVQLSLAAGAPAIRTFVLLPASPPITLDRAPYTQNFGFTPWIDADPGLSRAVRWRISGDTASVAFDPITGRLSYRCLPTTGYPIVTARALADTTVVATATVTVKGHPAATGDPPCS